MEGQDPDEEAGDFARASDLALTPVGGQGNGAWSVDELAAKVTSSGLVTL